MRPQSTSTTLSVARSFRRKRIPDILAPISNGPNRNKDISQSRHLPSTQMPSPDSKTQALQPGQGWGLGKEVGIFKDLNVFV